MKTTEDELVMMVNITENQLLKAVEKTDDIEIRRCFLAYENAKTALSLYQLDKGMEQIKKNHETKTNS